MTRSINDQQFINVSSIYIYIVSLYIIIYIYTQYIYNICIICQVDEVINQTYNSGDPFLYHQHRARLLRPDPPHDLGENVDHLCHVVMRFRHLCLHLPCWPKINRICSIAGNPGSCFPWSMSEITFSFTKLCPKWLAVHLHHGCQNTRGTQVALVYHQFPGSLSHKKWSTNMNIMNQQFKKKKYTMIVDALPKVTNFPCHDNKHFKYQSYSPVATSFSSDFKLPSGRFQDSLRGGALVHFHSSQARRRQRDPNIKSPWFLNGKNGGLNNNQNWFNMIWDIWVSITHMLKSCQV